MPTLSYTPDNKGIQDDLTLLNPAVTAMGNQTGSITVTALEGLVTMTATGNLTIALTAGQKAGDTLTLQITQDGTGSRTLTEGTLMKLAGGAVTLTTTATTGRDMLTFMFNGTNWNEIARALAVA